MRSIGKTINCVEDKCSVKLKELPSAALAAVSHCPALRQDRILGFVVAAAKKEGKVVVYNMALGAPYYGGREIVRTKDTASPSRASICAPANSRTHPTEQSAGRYLGDAEMVTTTMIEEQRKNGDFIQKLPPSRMPRTCGRRSRPPSTAFPPTSSRWEF
jgi:iron(III) transport system substrate-binding protein